MKARAWILAALAIVLMGAESERAATVYVPIFRSQSFGHRENLVLTELVIKGIERHTPYKVVGSLEQADVVLEGSFSADASGDLHLKSEWTDKRTKKAVSMKTVFKPSPAAVSQQLETISEFVVDGMKLLK
jgi:hypothetical protein